MKLFLLYFFATLIASAKSLSCECTNCTSGTSCTADEGGACIAVTGNIKTGSNRTSGIFSGCWSSQTPLVCKEEEMFITAGKQFSWNTKTICCHEDNCNAVNPEALKEDTTPSELMCPTCFALGSESCSATMTKCAKSQNHCLTIIGTITTGTKTVFFYGEGCATPTASNLASGTKLTFGETTYIITSSHIEKAKDGPSQDILTSSSKPSTTLPASNSTVTPTSSKTPTTLPASNSTVTPTFSKTPTTLPASNSTVTPTSSKTPTTLPASNSTVTPTSSKVSTPSIRPSDKPLTKSAKPMTTSTSATSATSVFTILLPSLLGLLLDKFIY